MLTLLLIVLAAMAWWASRRRRNVTAMAIAGCATALVVASGCGFLPGYLLDRLQRDYETATGIPTASSAANAITNPPVIVLLGLGTEQLHSSGLVETGSFAYGRLMAALRVYQACKLAGGRCPILISGGDLQGRGSTEAQTYAEVLIAAGVAPGDVLYEPKSHNTWENAKFTAGMLSEQQRSRVLLVTSGIHLKRALLYFQHFGIQATPVRGDYLAPVYSWLPSSFNLLLTDLALHEYAGLIRYRLYNTMGWNEKPAITRP